MQYKQRAGIVTTKICNMTVLIPSRAASEHCNCIQKLPSLWAATWSAIGRGVPMSESISIHMMITKKSEEEVIASLDQFCKEMVRKGFMIVIDDDSQPNLEKINT